jgi:homogentisate 1,2-dioxygenase
MFTWGEGFIEQLTQVCTPTGQCPRATCSTTSTGLGDSWLVTSIHPLAGNEFESEALPGALPKGKNNPKRCPFGLYAEQVSGTAFTAARSVNKRSWLYRILPSVVHDPFNPIKIPNECLTANSSVCVVTPNQLRWRCFPMPTGSVDFVRGLFTLCCAGSAGTKEGYAIHVYTATASMQDCCLANADGDFLVVPQQGMLTESCWQHWQATRPMYHSL